MSKIVSLGGLCFLLLMTGCAGLLSELLVSNCDNLVVQNDFRPDPNFGNNQPEKLPTAPYTAKDIAKIPGVVWLELVIGPKSNYAGTASGFLVNYAGKPHVVSAGHICRGPKYLAIYCYFSEKLAKPEEVEIIAADEILDIALLRFKDPKFTYAAYPKLGCSEKLCRGEKIFPYGSPFGFDFMVREGIVNKLDFGLIYRGTTQPQVILHDATINPGDSGGPLFNELGEIVGINVMGINPYRFFGSTATTISGAIPIDDVKYVLRKLNKSGYVEHAYMGWKLFSTKGLNPLNYKDKGVEKPKRDGLMVYEVAENSPAEKAGLKVGDILLECDGIKNPATYNEVARHILFDRRPGDELKLKIYRETRWTDWIMLNDERGYPYIHWRNHAETKELTVKVVLEKTN